MKTLADVTILRPAATPDADPERVSGATVAKLLAAAEVLDFANPDHQHVILEGVAELQRVLGNVTEDGDAWRPGECDWVPPRGPARCAPAGDARALGGAPQDHATSRPPPPRAHARPHPARNARTRQALSIVLSPPARESDPAKALA